VETAARFINPIALAPIGGRLMTTYYVSSIVGSDNNAGTSGSAPLFSLQAAEALVKPGDTVEVMDGIYTGPAYGNVLTISTSGTGSAPITFEAAPGQTPVINSSGGWNGINIVASYIVVKGFTVEGDAANYTLAQAMAGYSTGNASLDGNGITIGYPTNSVPLPNHITIENNTVYNEPGGGIGTEGADYVQILNNVVHDTSHWSAFGNSGISISTSANLDANPGAHIIVSGNTVYGNAQEVPTIGGNTITDGEGIILDTNPGFVGEMLVEKNTVYDNGSAGIESFLTDGAVIIGNTLYGNNTGNLLPASDAQIFINQSNNDTVTNNIMGGLDVPEPSTWAMLFIGFVCLQYLSYRLGRKRKNLWRIALVRRCVGPEHAFESSLDPSRRAEANDPANCKNEIAASVQQTRDVCLGAEAYSALAME
jgi:hypothetical protein